LRVGVIDIGDEQGRTISCKLLRELRPDATGTLHEHGSSSQVL
jgi:hypothetical protein